MSATTTSQRSRQQYHRHHALHHKLQALPSSEPALLEQAAVDKLLIESIKTICEEQAFRQEIQDPAIESLALEALRNAVEEFVLEFCSKVRRSMLAARRTTPIATDFETAIDVLDVPRPDDQILPYHTRPGFNPALLPTPPPEDPFHHVVTLPPSFLGPELDGQSELKKFSFNTASLPPLPSAHTYKDTPVYPRREVDSRRIRELATEEGKLGEQALRKLAGAVKLDAAHPIETDTARRASATSRWSGRQRRRPGLDWSEEAVFEDTVRDLLKDEPNGFELGPIVTCEKAYRMPDDVQVRRRPALTDQSGLVHSSSSAVPDKLKGGSAGPDTMAR